MHYCHWASTLIRQRGPRAYLAYSPLYTLMPFYTELEMWHDKPPRRCSGFYEGLGLSACIFRSRERRVEFVCRCCGHAFWQASYFAEEFSFIEKSSYVSWHVRSLQWCGLRPSVLGQYRSETKNRPLFFLGLAGLVLRCETRSYHGRRHNDLEGHSNFSSTIYISLFFYSVLGTSLLWISTVAFTCTKVKSAKCLCLLPVVLVLVLLFWSWSRLGLGLKNLVLLRHWLTSVICEIPLLAVRPYFKLVCRHRRWCV